jgi:type IV pilus assembly protein PilV
MTPRNLTHVRSRSAGFTLVETLVAVLVLSIGLLGVAALQLSSLRSNATATQRTQATFLAHDITDRMRANRAAAVTDSAYLVTFAEFAAIPVPAVGGATLAERDLSQWKEQILAVLPRDTTAGAEPDAQISRPAGAAPGEFEISIRWDDTRGAELNGGDNRVRFDMQTRVL